MTAKLTLELENKTKPGFVEIIKDLVRLGNEGRDASRMMDGLNREMDSRVVIDATERVDDLAEQYEHLADKAQEAARAQHSLNDASKPPSDVTGGGIGWLTFASKAHVAVTALRGVYEGGKRAWEGINYLADKGIPAFQGLEAAGNKFGKSVIDIASDKRLGKWVGACAVGMENLTILFGDVADAGLVVADSIFSVVEGLTSLVGIKLDGLADQTKDLGNAAEQAKNDADFAAFKKRMGEGHRLQQQRAAEVDAINAKRHADAMLAADIEALAKVKDLGLIEKAIVHNREAEIRHQKAMKTWNDDQYNNAKKAAKQVADNIDRLEKRKQVIIREQKEAAAALAAEETKIREQMDKQVADQRQLLTLEAARREAEAKARIEKALAEKEAAAKNMADAKAAAVNQFSQFIGVGGGGFGGGMWSGVGGGFQNPQQSDAGKPTGGGLGGFQQPQANPKPVTFAELRDLIRANKPLVAAQVIRNRGDKVVEDERRRAKKLNQPFSKDRERRIRARSRGQTMRDIRQGNVSRGEGEKAVSDLFNKAGEVMKQRGDLSELELRTIEQTLKNQNQQGELTGKMIEKMNHLDALAQQISQKFGILLDAMKQPTLKAQKM